MPTQPTSSSSVSTAKMTSDHSLRKYTVLDPSPTQLSTPQCSPHSCELSAPPSSSSNPPNRRSFSFFPNSGRDRRRGALPVVTLFQSVSRLSSGRFKFFSFPRCSCARSFSLDVNRSTGMTSPRLERPPNDTASVASSFGYLLEPRNVSTTLSNLRGSSLARPFALYRALVAGPRSAMAAARHSRGRGGR
jgi:hypothetical protein